jgi:hypothetical protein
LKKFQKQNKFQKEINENNFQFQPMRNERLYYLSHKFSKINKFNNKVRRELLFDL